MRIAPALALSSACLCLAAPAGAAPRFQWLELPPAAEDSEVTGISGDGCVVLGRSGTRALRWVAGSVQELPRYLSAPAVSADGSVLLATSVVPAAWRVWFVEDHGTALRMPPPPDSYGLFAGAVSADGRVAVGGLKLDPNPTHTDSADAVRYEGGVFTTVASNGASAQGVSADGSVVVGDSRGDNAFRWEAGSLVYLGFGDATAVSADGSVVVGQGGARAFRWQAGVLRDLGPGKALDTSADGALTVGAAGVAPWLSAAAWLEPETQLALTDLLAGWGIDAAGLTLTEATAISDDALAIAGNGVDPQGRARAWLATRGERDCSPAEPPPAPVRAPLPAPTLFPFYGPSAPWVYLDTWNLRQHVTADGVPYVFADAYTEEAATGDYRMARGIHQIGAEGGTSRTLVEGAFEGLAADGESVVAVLGDRWIRVSRQDGSSLADVNLGPTTYVASSPIVDLRGNAFASALTLSGGWYGAGCLAVSVLTRSGYAGLLTDPDGSPCIDAPWAAPEWHRGALHLWNGSELWRREADGTLSTVLAVGDGITSLGEHGFDALGNLYVADSEALVVYKITPAGERIPILDHDGDLVGHPLDESPFPYLHLEVDGRGHVLVSDRRRVFEIFPNGAIQIAASSDGEGARVHLPSSFYSIDRLDLDAAGNLYATASYDGIVGIPPSTEVPEPAVPDRDGDAFPDALDNCDFYPNPEQRDRDADGHGDLCDADFDQNGVVGVSDLVRLGASFGARAGEARYDPALDMNSDGALGAFEYLRLVRAFGTAPGVLRP